jgi:type II secretory pathway component PulJ
LTKDGKVSATGEGAAYIRISYSKHILPWLDKCLRETYRMIPINQGIQQYREVVRYITGKTLDSSNMKPIVEFITQNPDVIRFRKQLDEAINETIANFFDRFGDEIKKNLHEFQVRSHEHRKFGVDPNDALILTTPNLPFEIFIEYDTVEKVVALGISGAFDTSPTTEENKMLFIRMYEALKREANACGSDQNNTTTNWPTGWRDLIEGLDNEGLAKLLQRQPSKIASEICEKIRSHIKVLEQIYIEVTK